MTRINLVAPSELVDEHLMAEYRELPRIFKAAPQYKGSITGLPESYRLGTGHVKFFYNKLDFLEERWLNLVQELVDRGFDLSAEYIAYVNGLMDTVPDHLRQSKWKPSPDEVYINMQRIALRYFERREKENAY